MKPLTNLKAISLWQPWALLWALQLGKEFETRSWATHYKGPLAIHAAMTKNADLIQICEQEPFKSKLQEAGYSNFMSLPRGCILAVCDGVECLRIVTPPAGLLPRKPIVVNGRGKETPVGDLERAFGDYSDGRFAWKPMGMRPLINSVPCKGAQGLWDVPPDIITRIEKDLALTH